MNTAELLRLARQLVSLPTAPYHEQAVRAFVEQHCRSLGLRTERDAAGNVLVRYQYGARRAPLLFVAHMDHPGFEALGPNHARFLGSVPQEMFRRGARVRFHTAKGIVHARIRRRLGDNRCVELSGGERLRRGDFGGWELPTFRCAGGRMYGVGFDDVLGVAAVVAALTAVVKHRVRTRLWGLFTRAEEVGLTGAVEAARRGRISTEALVLSFETSKERPWARIADGPVIRVGDRMSVFDPAATWFLEETARRCGLRAQRCLMDGGICEATAFAAYGYRVGGLCVALGNYHNIGGGQRPAAEVVSVSDFAGWVALAVEAARAWPRFEPITKDVQQRVDRIYRSAPRRLNDHE